MLVATVLRTLMSYLHSSDLAELGHEENRLHTLLSALCHFEHGLVNGLKWHVSDQIRSSIEIFKRHRFSTYAQSQAISSLIVVGVRLLRAIFHLEDAVWSHVSADLVYDVMASIVLAVHRLAPHLVRVGGVDVMQGIICHKESELVRGKSVIGKLNFLPNTCFILI